MKTKEIFTLMKVVTWIIFIGLCIKLGTLIVTSSISLFFDPEAAQNLYLGLDLSQLQAYSRQYFLYSISFGVAIAALQAYLLYLVTTIFSKINIAKPFNIEIATIISNISHYALFTGIIAIICRGFHKWLLKAGVDVPLDWGGSGYLFMAGILFVIAYIFKRGVALQEENNLTI